MTARYRIEWPPPGWDLNEPTKFVVLASDYDREVAALREEIARLKERNERQAESLTHIDPKAYAHMCRDEHVQIGHNDSGEERCPLCRALDDKAAVVADRDALKLDNERLREWRELTYRDWPYLRDWWAGHPAQDMRDLDAALAGGE